MKRLIAAVITVGVVTLGTAGVAAAQQTGGSTSPSTQPAANSSGTSNAKTARRGTQRAALRIAAKTLGLKPKDVLTGLCGGKTVAQLASQQGKSVSDVTNALDKAADARMEKAQKAGRITAAQATQRESQVNSRVTKLVNSYQPSAQVCQRLQSGAATPTTSA
jgi:hypothetical protein